MIIYYITYILLTYCTYSNVLNIYNQQETNDEPMEAKIEFNVAYSYDVIIETAKDVQAQESWQLHEQVSKLMFSSHWVRGLLDRAKLRRRKITREDKLIPSLQEIRGILKIGQDLILQNGHTAETIYNMDETAYTWCVGPTHLFCPSNQQRAANLGIANTKLRITAVITVGANGNFAPLMIIIKHSANSKDRPDQSTMKVIRDLYKKPQFGIANNWKLLLWEKSLQIADKLEDHKCWYMIHEPTGHVITSQHKAWNDQVRMIMWLELIMLPLKINLSKLLVWFDNCGCHKTNVVQNYIREIGIDVAYLPPNMTAILQVLDLVVNGPLKSHVRQLRAKRIVKSFKEFLIVYRTDLEKTVDDRENPKFTPPKPEMIQAIVDLFHLFENGFKEEKFKNGIRSSFIKTGTVPIISMNPDNFEFTQYNSTSISGSMKTVIPLGTKMMDNIIPALDNDVVFSDAINIFLDAEDDMEDDENLDEL